MFTGPFGSETLADVEDTESLFTLHERLLKLQIAVEDAGRQANSTELLEYHNDVQWNVNRVREHLQARPEVSPDEMDQHMESMRDWYDSQK